MPHIVVEYSANLDEKVDIDTTLVELHAALTAQGIDQSRIKTRAHRLEHSVVGQYAPNEGKMAHITLSLLQGRDVPTLQKYGTAIHGTAKALIQAQCPECKVTMEVREMVKETYILE